MIEIRQYTTEDIPAMTEIWCSSFDEDISNPKMFFRRLPEIGSAVVLVDDGTVVAMVSVITGQSLLLQNAEESETVGYIYALAVDEKYRGRGYGAEIAKASYDFAVKLGASVVCTLPSNEPLYGFYEKTIGLETALYRKKYEVQSEDLEMTMKLDASEYLEMRRIILEGKTSLNLSEKAMEFECALCEMYGGGLFATSGGICAAQSENDVCIIFELLSDEPERTAASVAYDLNCKKAVYYLPSDSSGGERYIMAEKGKIPIDTVWNIAYD